MTTLREAAQQALEALERSETTVPYEGFGMAPVRKHQAAITALRAALAQEQAVTDDMRSAVRWAPSSAYWSERLREFFGPDAREGIDALERRLAEAQEPEGGGNLPPPLQAEFDLSRCPRCNGPADNGHDRSIPPSPYLCTRCMDEPTQEPVAWYQKRGQEVLTSHPACWGREDEPWAPLYTAPPRRTMVPLTDEEIAAMVRAEVEALPSYPSAVEELPYRLARVIEKASWEKNNG